MTGAFIRGSIGGFGGNDGKPGTGAKGSRINGKLYLKEIFTKLL